MTKSLNGSLCYENFVTYRTMFALGQASFSAGRSNCLVGNLGVTERLNSFLCYEDFVTGRAVFALGKTSSGAGGRYCLVGNLGVTKHLNGFLHQKNFVTYGAVLAFSKTCTYTSGSHSRIDFLSVYMWSRSGILRSSQLESCFTRCCLLVIVCWSVIVFASGEHQRTYKQNQTHKQCNFHCLSHNLFTFTFQPVGILVLFLTTMSKTKSAATEATALKTQTPIVAKPILM